MKKVILLFTSALFTMSCSDDDKAPAASPLPLASKITITSGAFTQVYDFTYDNERRLQAFDMSGETDRSIGFTYNQKNLIASMSISEGGTTNTSTFAYNDKDQFVSMTGGGITTPISYNEATRTYTIGTFVFAIDDSGDMISTGPVEIFYETGKFGAMTHANMSTHLMAAFLGDNLLLYFAGRKPSMEIKSSGATQVIFQNTYNESAYLTKSVIDIGGDSITAIYEYTSI